MPQRRSVDVAVISDIHLGTPNARTDMLMDYLHRIRPRTLIINGDLCDLGHYWRNHWPAEHLMVLRRILKMAAKGSSVYLLVGNHDAPARRFHGTSLGNVHIRGRLELDHNDGSRTLVVHGDCFDGAVACPAWLHGFGGWLYERSMGMGTMINSLRSWVGKPPISLATSIKNNLGMAQRYIERFRMAAVESARKGGFDRIITGHIHQPDISEHDGISYLNSGDWVEHCTALEYQDGAWQLHWHQRDEQAAASEEEDSHGEVERLFDHLGRLGKVIAA